MEIHHASQSGGEAQSVLDASVSVQPHQRVPLGDVVQEADEYIDIDMDGNKWIDVRIRIETSPSIRRLPVFVVGEKSVGPVQVEIRRILNLYTVVA